MINRYMCAYGTEFTKGINGHWCEWPEVEQVIAENQRLQDELEKQNESVAPADGHIDMLKADLSTCIAEVERLENALMRLQQARLERGRELVRALQRAKKAEAELAEAEKEIHVRAEGEE